MTQIFPLRRLFLVHSWFCQGSFFPHQSRRRHHSSRIFKAFWLVAPPFRQLITPHHHPHPFQRISCWPVMCWSATTPSSRRCRRCMMGRFWFWKGLYIFSRFRLVPGLKQSQLIASSLATPHRMCRPLNGRTEVIRQMPPSCQCHASLLAFQPRSCLQLRNVTDGSLSPAHWSPLDRYHPCVRRQHRPTLR